MDFTFTTLLVVLDDGTMKVHYKFPNAYLGSFLIKYELGNKYKINNPIAMCYDGKKHKEIYSLLNNPTVSINDQITLATTIDRVLVNRKDIAVVVKAFLTTAKTIASHCNITQQAKVIEQLIDNQSIAAIGWNHTSIDVWKDYFDGTNYHLSLKENHKYLTVHNESLRICSDSFVVSNSLCGESSC